jgi:DNA-binding CsgD family transcriptional regulator/tetratricopeptide (TPR) repeat protein
MLPGQDIGGAVAAAPMTEIRPGAFVGRKTEIALCREVLTRAIHGRGRTLLIDGEPGIGKSTLLGEILTLARNYGCTVLLGRADDLAQQFPMQVILDGLGGEPAAAVLGPAQAAPGAAYPLPGEPGGDPTGLLERVVAVVTSLCAQSPVVLAIDDLQWADDQSLLAWQRLSELAPDLPLVMIGTWSPVPHRPELLTLKQRLASAHQLVTSLGPLAADEVIELVGVLAGGDPGDRLRRLADRAGGNPLYVTELVDALVRGERLLVADGVADIVIGQQPQVLSAVISERLNFLSPEAKRMLRFAALLGRHFTAAEMAAVADLSAGQLATALAEVQVARVIAESDGRFFFRHLLIRQAIYDSIPSAFRVALHQQAARSLADAGAAVERVAEQLLATTQTATNPWVRNWLAGAGPQLVQRSPRMAVELLRLALADIPPEDPGRDQLEGSLATALLRLSRHQEATDVAWPLLARARDTVQRSRTVQTLGYALLGSGRDREALHLIEGVLSDPLLGHGWRARLRALIALIHLLAGRQDDAAEVAGRALVEGQNAGDPHAVAHCLHILSLLRARESDNGSVAELTGQALAIPLSEPGSDDLRSALLLTRMAALLELGELTQADAALGTVQELAGQGDVPVQLAEAAAEYYLRVGRWDEAMTQLLASITGTPVLIGYPAPSRSDPLRHGISALIAGHRDDRAMATAHLKAAGRISRYSQRGASPGHTAYLILATALAAERDGRLEEALKLLEPALHADDAEHARLRGQCLPVLVRLALEVGRADLARTAASIAEEAAAGEPTAIRRAAAEHCRGLVTRDPDLLLSAAKAYRGIGLPIERAQAVEDAAELLAITQRPTQARRALNEAAQVYAALGAEWDIRRADTRLRRHGIRRGRSRAPGSAQLTPTEAKIARLISLGWSTPDIAKDLLLSPRTVQTHVSHILRKINGRSRLDIVRASVTAGPGAWESGPLPKTKVSGELPRSSAPLPNGHRPRRRSPGCRQRLHHEPYPATGEHRPGSHAPPGTHHRRRGAPEQPIPPAWTARQEGKPPAASLHVRYYPESST